MYKIGDIVQMGNNSLGKITKLSCDGTESAEVNEDTTVCVEPLFYMRNPVWITAGCLEVVSHVDDISEVVFVGGGHGDGGGNNNNNNNNDNNDNPN